MLPMKILLWLKRIDEKKRAEALTLLLTTLFQLLQRKDNVRERYDDDKKKIFGWRHIDELSQMLTKVTEIK